MNSRIDFNSDRVTRVQLRKYHKKLANKVDADREVDGCRYAYDPCDGGAFTRRAYGYDANPEITS